MTFIFSLCAFGILGAILLKISDEISPKFRPLILCGAGIIFFLLFIKWLFPLFQVFQKLCLKSEQHELFLLLLKALALSLIVSFSASFCRDLGEDKMAEKMELGGKAALFSLSIPVLEKILNWIEVLAS